jgi:hypothetical protein
MKTAAIPQYNITHHTPNANRRACHRDYRGDDSHCEVEIDSSRPGVCTGDVRNSPLKKDCYFQVKAIA